MAKKTTKEELIGGVTPENQVRDLLIKKAKDIFEREPHQAFVPKNLDTLVREIVDIFK